MRLRVRTRPAQSFARRMLGGLRIALAVTGVVCLAIFGWLEFERYYFGSQYEQEFERAVEAAREARLPEAPVLAPRVELPEPERSVAGSEPGNSASPGDLQVLARLRIARLGLQVAVLEGVEDRALRRGAGWIPGTARPGETGNIGIAAHRDTFFRPLREIRTGDRIELETLQASQSYTVESVLVVEPDYDPVLEPTIEPTLTLVTCFPFDYVGPAPRRYIVRAVAGAEALRAGAPGVE